MSAGAWDILGTEPMPVAAGNNDNNRARHSEDLRDYNIFKTIGQIRQSLHMLPETSQSV